MQTTTQIRKTFLDFFKREGHEHVASSPLVPLNDPTLMFTNAGMVQFKNVFTGNEQRPYKRAVTSQKCVRAGGKHNDLDNVGHTARHHTFFEMLGNFSFGDYFKAEAIDMAWRLVTKDYGLPADRLLVTVHSSDEDAAGLWKKIAGLPDEKILRIPTSDNFWSMGETGPCGPCSEIFYDHGEHIPGGPPGSPDEDGDRFIEIWNLVFMQFEQITKDERVDLPHPSIDTGMGLERIAAVLQGKHDNYDIDLMRTLIEAIAAAGGTDPDGPHQVSHRVIADHIRSCGFLIADGVLPSNEGRGYVLRRIMRRAMRHAHMMGVRDPIMHRLVPTLVHEMGQTFPELERAQALMTETLKLEEGRFRQMLDRGLRLLADETAGLAEGGTLPGEVAFKLYDTYGFPLDLTQDALRGQGMTVDTAGFNAAMERQRAEARKAWAGSGDAATEKVWFELQDRLGGTDFLGYATESAEGQITAIVVDGAPVEAATPGTEVAIIANQSPFYGESGGQMGDTGVISVPEKGRVRVRDTQKKLGDLIVHLGVVENGPISVGDEARFDVDGSRRSALRAHHSATHLLHEALRRVLGEHVTQKGSLVAPDRLRFDISHPKPLSAEEKDRVEAIVNSQIRANEAVTTRLMEPEAAIEAGAMALFGEKYGDEVRVVSMGTSETGSRAVYSVELCGGTHVGRTGDIGLLKIVGEGAVAAGVRRIEAVVGDAALGYFNERDALLAQAAEALRASPADVPARVTALLDERKRLEKELADTRKKLALGGGGGGAGAAPADKTVAGVTFAGRLLSDVPAKDLKGMADEIKKQIGSGVVALVNTADGKVSLVVGVTEDLKGTHDAVALVRAGSAAVGGKGGGGRPDMAQAGGPDADKAPDALAAIEAALGGG
ncbi:alanine--tRNA ligase [Rhodospira trueperi]|uniref:Alanine--tRNA ligase n=1 Tax=Rhodospira trueperi TaxID=69960 RepID=A0A1G6YPI8_9PROT|nr:alanine--tRNA ligase [Rhodospira trueperi]SDD92309.1 alanyl-tRNA synthetase [Rhodospira trueperi]